MVIGLVVGSTVGGHFVWAEGKTFQFTSSFTIPAALDLKVTSPEMALRLEGAPGQPATAKLALRVGTNDWPLDLHLGLVAAETKTPGFTLLYQFVEGHGPAAAWISVPTFSAYNPVAGLPSPAWTDYTLGVRVTPPKDAVSGTYTWTLRLLLRSRSGRVESVDIPVQLVIP